MLQAVHKKSRCNQPQSSQADHWYALTESPRKLKRRCEEVKEILHVTKRALYNVQRREARAKTTVGTLLTEVENKKLLASEAH